MLPTRLNKKLKGQSGTVLLVAVTMGVLLSGFVAMALTQQLPPLFAEKVNDAGPITDVESRADYLMHGYMEQSAKFSYYEAAYQVGDYGNAESAIGIPAKYGSGHGGYNSDGDDYGSTADIKNFYSTYFNWIENEGSDHLENYTDSLDSASPRCQITKPSGGYDLGVVREEPQISVESRTDEPLIKEVACARPTITANYSVNKQSLDLKTQNSHLHNMAIATSRALGGMWNKSEDIDGGADSGDVSAESACFTDGNAGNAKDFAKNLAEQEAYGEIETQVNNIENRGENEMQSINSGNVGIPLLNAVMDLIYKGFDQTPDNGVELHDNDTSVSESSSQKVNCDSDNAYCENWDCGSGFTTGPDLNGDDKPSCEVDGSIPGPSCSEGSPEGDYCENTSANSQSECGSGQTWYSGPNLCAHNGLEPCSDYNGVDTTESYGSCVLDESPPEPTCSNWQEKWEATYDYQLERVEFDTSVLDESRVPTSADANTRLPIERRFIYDFD